MDEMVKQKREAEMILKKYEEKYGTMDKARE
jgi:hypothetical protein